MYVLWADLLGPIGVARSLGAIRFMAGSANLRLQDISAEGNGVWVDTDALINSLTLDEKAELTAGADVMSTVGIQRVGIPAIGITDGPSGARGPSFPGLGGPSSTCIPCGSAIGATWNPGLAERLGVLLGREALDRGCAGLLAPTVNLHRHPLAGRNFECYSEDPLLSGLLAAAYVNGVQSMGVFATVKHFVGNEAEFERSTISSVIDERSLRELYLLPFEIAIREGGALGLMTSYNRVNGRWLTEQRELLVDILRNEWGFEGLIMTDWFAAADTAASLRAGIDLEMPGPGRALGSVVATAVKDGVVEEADLDRAVGHLLGVFDRIGAMNAPRRKRMPSPPGPEDLELLRRASAEATVLLCNDGILPLQPSSLQSVAIIGPHSIAPCVVGGGSANVVTARLLTPLESLSALLGDQTKVVSARGCEDALSPSLIGEQVLEVPDGFDAEFYGNKEFAGESVRRDRLETLRLAIYKSMTDQLLGDEWSARVRGTLLSQEDGAFQLALAQSGRARVIIDGVIVLDGFTNPPPSGGIDFFGMVSQDLVAEIKVSRGVPIDILVEYASIDVMVAGFRVGFRTVDSDALLERAIDVAAGADVAVVFVGNTEEWETETRDRTFFELPGRQPEMIRRIASANDRTVVVVNAGAPVDMSWSDDVAAVLQCWFGGQEMAAGVTAVLTGQLEPGGRLPMSIPVCLEQSPSHDNFPGENGELRYGEGLFMGYRGYEHRKIVPKFAFGAGISYTTFAFGEATLSASSISSGDSVTVAVQMANTGTRGGSEVVQCYVAPVKPRLARPLKELKAFSKVWLEPGESKLVELELTPRSFAYWDPGQSDWTQVLDRQFDMFGSISEQQDRRPPGWQVDEGDYDVLIGRSSADITSTCRLHVFAPAVSPTSAGTDPTEREHGTTPKR